MIDSRSTCVDWITADLDRFDGPRWRTLLLEPLCRWLVLLRIAEWRTNTARGPGATMLALAWRALARSRGRRLGYTIPVNVLGRGVRLCHTGTIVMSGAASVGPNSAVYHGVTLADHRGAPRVAGDVVLGANATLVGPVHVGARAWVGAGAVVSRDVPAGERWAGNPAAAVSARRPRRDGSPELVDG